jgi:hypothetical protein
LTDSDTQCANNASRLSRSETQCFLRLSWKLAAAIAVGRVDRSAETLDQDSNICRVEPSGDDRGIFINTWQKVTKGVGFGA